MSIVIETFLICDGCGENFGVDDRMQTGKTHRLRAKAEGWKVYNGKDFCSDCINLKRAQWYLSQNRKPN